MTCTYPKGVVDCLFMKHTRTRSISFAIGAILVLFAVLVAVYSLLPQTRSGTVAVSVYTANGPIGAGTLISSSNLTTVTLDLPPGFAGEYLNPANFSQYAGQQLMVTVSPGSLVPLNDLVPLINSRQVVLTVSFKEAPALAAGNVVDVYIIAGTNATGTTAPAASVIPLLKNVVLETGAAGGWNIAVPAQMASALIYASNNSTLVAVLVAPGNRNAFAPQVSSLGQALQIIRQAGS